MTPVPIQSSQRTTQELKSDTPITSKSEVQNFPLLFLHDIPFPLFSLPPSLFFLEPMQAPTLYTDRYNDSSAIRLTCQASNNLHRNITYHWKTDLIQTTNSTRSIILNIEDYISVTCTVTDGVSKNSITIMVPLRGNIRFPVISLYYVIIPTF